MAERMKDEEDRKLDLLFRSEPVADDGFSVGVVSRVRRRMWVRRLSLPVGIVVGGAIAAKPLTQMAGAIPGLMNIIPGGLISIDKLPLGGLPQASTLIFGATLLMVVMLASRLLEE